MRTLQTTLLIMLMTICGATAAEATASSGNQAPAVLLTIAPNRPPCDNPYAASDQNCYGTQATTHTFPVPIDTVLWFPQQPSERVSWVFVGPVVVEPTELARALWLHLSETNAGYQLQVGVDHQSTKANLVEGNWVPLQIPLEPRFWVRLEPNGAETQH